MPPRRTNMLISLERTAPRRRTCPSVLVLEDVDRIHIVSTPPPAAVRAVAVGGVEERVGHAVAHPAALAPPAEHPAHCGSSSWATSQRWPSGSEKAAVRIPQPRSAGP